MTKEITKARILQEMQDKFRMRELEPAKFEFSETVIPVYNIEPHLLKPEVKSQTFTIIASGERVFLTVPDNEKWQLHRYNVIFITGVYTIAGVMIYRPAVGNWIYLDLKAAQNVSYLIDLPKDVTLSPGERIAINVDGYTSSGSLALRVDVTVEEIR